MSEEDNEVTLPKYKLVLAGPVGVGKSALTIRFAQNHFVSEYDPYVQDWYMKMINLDDELFIIEFLDSAGDGENAVTRNEYMKTADGFLVVFGLDDRSSFDQLDAFREQIKKAKDTSDVPMVLVGNKSDLQDYDVELGQAKELAQKYNIPFVKTSAKTGAGVADAFNTLINEIRKKNPQ